jgi:hypothetical protein
LIAEASATGRRAVRLSDVPLFRHLIVLMFAPVLVAIVSGSSISVVGLVIGVTALIALALHSVSPGRIDPGTGQTLPDTAPLTDLVKRRRDRRERRESD